MATDPAHATIAAKGIEEALTLSAQCDPERTYRARRDAVYDRLVTDGIPPEAAERWIWAWETEGRVRSLDRHAPVFWDDGLAWIAQQKAIWAHPPQRR